MRLLNWPTIISPSKPHWQITTEGVEHAKQVEECFLREALSPYLAACSAQAKGKHALVIPAVNPFEILVA
jgi:hypothetical protein